MLYVLHKVYRKTLDSNMQDTTKRQQSLTSVFVLLLNNKLWVPCSKRGNIKENISLSFCFAFSMFFGRKAMNLFILSSLHPIYLLFKKEESRSKQNHREEGFRTRPRSHAIGTLWTVIGSFLEGHRSVVDSCFVQMRIFARCSDWREQISDRMQTPTLFSWPYFEL